VLVTSKGRRRGRAPAAVASRNRNRRPRARTPPLRRLALHARRWTRPTPPGDAVDEQRVYPPSAVLMHASRTRFANLDHPCRT
jgi:hypothetical protein